MFERLRVSISAARAAADARRRPIEVEGLESRRLLDAVPAAPTVLVPVPAGAEFRVNTTTDKDEGRPAVAADADGDFVVVWESAGPEGNNYVVFGQRYSADGTPAGTEFRVSPNASPVPAMPKVAMDEAGDFVVAWETYVTGGDDILARRYAADGTPRANAFRVNSIAAGFQREASVAMARDGSFVVSWTGWDQVGGSSSDVYGRRYAADGAAKAPEFRVNSVVAGFQNGPAVAIDGAGNPVFAWYSYGGAPADTSNVIERRFTPNGTALGPTVRVNTKSTFVSFGVAVAADDAGDFAVGWGGSVPGNVASYVRSYDPSGAPRGDEQAAIPSSTNDTRTTLSMDHVGNVVVSGESAGGGAVRFYDAAGTPRGPATSVEQFGTVALRGKGGSFVLAGSRSNDEPEPTEDVYAQRYSIGEVESAARVVSRQVFYRQNPLGMPLGGPQDSDDAAIAIDKRPLLPGETPSFANVISFSKGINGLMVDIAGLRPGAILNAEDFSYGAAKHPYQLGVRPGAGVDGSDRYAFLWYDNDPTIDPNVAATLNGWLTVTAKAANLGLAGDDVFSFGQLSGESGDNPAAFRVTALDLAAVKRALNSDAPVTSTTDFNRDGRTNALDVAIVKRNLNHVLPLMQPAAPAPAKRSSWDIGLLQ